MIDEYDHRDPRNQETADNDIDVKDHLIKVFNPDKICDEFINFTLQIEDAGEELYVYVIEYSCPKFYDSWTEEIQLYLEDNNDKPIKMKSL